MGAEQAANVLADVKLRQLARDGQQLSHEQIAAIRDPVLADYRRQSSALYSTSRLWDDGILDPLDTRNALGIALSASLNQPIAPPSYGVFRI
jgi:3-methylcrotonyl-CoA carboxylase beta subunit